ncbi:hypothetical protein [Lutibacter sp.]
MKKIILFVAILVTTIAMSQQKAKVHTVNGIEVYILAEPVRQYEIINTAKNSVKWGSYLTGGLINESISTKVSKFVKKLLKDYTQKGIKFDAVLYTSGKNMTAIRFTDEETTTNKGVATIQRLNGIPFFVMSEPIKEYKYINTIGKGIKWKSLVTAGLLNNSIEQDLLKFAKKIENKYRKGKVNAVIYSNGKKAISILIQNI